MINTDVNVNYFTEIEEHFQCARGTGLFLMSPRDYALAKAWHDAGIPLLAVLRGIERTFENRRKSSPRVQIGNVNSLAYCSQAIAEEAQALAYAAPSGSNEIKAPFTIEAIHEFIRRSADALRESGHQDLARSLEALDIDVLHSDLEQLEQKVTTIEEKLIARERSLASEESLSDARHSLEPQLKPFRGKMGADQIAMLEKHLLERHLLKTSGLPRLSLFYLAQ